MRRLFVDDEREPPKDQIWDIARSYHEAVNLINENTYDVVSLDHDLACFDQRGHEFTGSDVLNYLVEMKFYDEPNCPQYVYVHSANPSAYKSMKLAIDKYFEQ